MQQVEFLKNQNLDLSLSCQDLRQALKQCIRVLRMWHGPESFEIYYDNAPEMALIRKAFPDFRGWD